MDNYFIQAQRVRRRIQEDFNQVFALSHPLYSKETKVVDDGEKRVDVLLAPCSLSPAPLLSDVLAEKSPLNSYVNDVLTVPASLAGIPALCIPVPGSTPGDEPVGMQLLAQYGDEDALFNIANALAK